MIGLGGARLGPDASTQQPRSCWPEPNVDYQIEPTNVYYLTFGNLTPGTLIDIDKIGTMCPSTS